MKYLEELNNGDIFALSDNKFVLSSDFRYKNKNIQKMCVNISNGFVQWFSGDTVVEYLDLYYRDIDGNILPLKDFPKNDLSQNSHIS